MMTSYVQIEYCFEKGPAITETYETTPELITALCTRRLRNCKVCIVERMTWGQFNLRTHEEDYDTEKERKH